MVEKRRKLWPHQKILYPVLTVTEDLEDIVDAMCNKCADHWTFFFIPCFT